MTGFSRDQVAGTAVTVAVTAAVIVGIYLLGSPSEERTRRLDERRVQDLSGISQAIDVYWTRQSALPSSLDQLRAETGANVSVSDPVTDARYEFRPIDSDRYELCAIFEGESRDSERGGAAGFWSHRAGRQCFQRETTEVR
jgi:hypothetical protein